MAFAREMAAVAGESEEVQPALHDEGAEVEEGLGPHRRWRQVAKSSAAAIGGLGLAALLLLNGGGGRPTKTGLLRGPVDESLEAVAVAPGNTPEQFLQIAGRSWEFTDNEDCWGHDIVTLPVKAVWGTPGAVEERAKCAEECIRHHLCVAFNYPSPHFPDPKSPFDPQVCYLKFTHMHTKEFGMTCEKGFNTHIWHYYTLEDGDVWQRQSDGFHRSRWPFSAKLPVADKTDVEWVSGTRWERGDGLKCSGTDLASFPVKDFKSEKSICAEKCLENQECIAFHFPELGKDGKWDSKAGKPECRLLSGDMKSLKPVFLIDCIDGQKTAAWKSYTLADAWHMQRNEKEELVRKQIRPLWTGKPSSPCKAEGEAGRWSLPGSGEEEEEKSEKGALDVRRLESLPCCKWSLNRCEEDAMNTCTPLAGFPATCVGMCNQKTANCTCWTEKEAEKDVAEDDEDCCTSCSYDCSGKQTCFPAGCSGAHKMCKSTTGSGSTCSCAEGAKGSALLVPPDVAAGWDVDQHAWTG